MRNYSVNIIITTLIALIAMASFNWIVDPFKIWNPPVIHGINTFPFQLPDIERTYKIIGLAHHSADVAILGSSRSDIGLNPNHPALGQNAINLGFSSQTYHETRMLYDFMTDHEATHTFVIGLDFFSANVFFPAPDKFVDDNFKPMKKWQLLFSSSTLADSVISILNFKDLPGNTWSNKGMRLRPDEVVKRENGNRSMMQGSEKQYLSSEYLPIPTCSFSFESTDSQISPLEELRHIFSRAHLDHTKLIFFISPSHAMQWETVAAAGLWKSREEWKRRLVQINEEEAKRAGQQPFALWDFSGYNSISTETIPAYGDTDSLMHWYSDSSHYTPAAGNLILDRVFNYKSPNRNVPDDFGVLLTSQNIETHLAHIRAAREHYRQTHPEQVAEMELISREVAKTKHCQAINKSKPAN